MEKKKRKGKYEKWYSEENIELIKGFARSGFIDKEISKEIGISIATFYNWKKEYPEFKEALETSKKIANIRVEMGLYKRALGYVAEDVEEHYNKKGELISKHVKKYHVKGDVTAQIIWLKNRDPENWRDRKFIEWNHAENETGVIEIASFEIPETIQEVNEK